MKTFSLLLLLTCFLCQAWAYAIERRKEQFPNETSYLVTPLPYSMPGVGSGLFLAASVSNAFETPTDAWAVAILGDAEGMIYGIDEVQIIPETLMISHFRSYINKAMLKSYKGRGMETDKDEFNYMELSNHQEVETRVVFSLWDRRFELFAESDKTISEISKIRNSEADIVYEYDEPSRSESTSMEYGILFDYTDDYIDPRQGFHVEISRSSSPPHDKDVDPEYYTDNVVAEVYIPLGKSSVWGFHYQTSSAIVTAEGETDPDKIIKEQGFNCATYNDCTEEQKQVIDNKILERKYGTARGLGGQRLLRAYPMNRYRGAHMQHFATEIRWNFMEDVVPFDFWIWKDVATGFQAAFFWETGTVAEKRSDLGKINKNCYGAGFRMVSGSGLVYRIDQAFGEEGTETTIMVNYPW